MTPFEEVEPALLAVVDLVDHRNWCEVVPSGTLEAFAPWLWGRLQDALRPFGLDLVALRLCEGERSEVAIDDRGVP